MSKDLIIALLSLVAIGSLAAVFVLWAKLDKQKKLTLEERDKRWDEISLRQNVENELEQRKEREKRTVEVIHYYADQLAECEWKRRRANNKNRDLQDKLSSILCPTNNHVWQDGVCTKCGRIQE